MDDGFCTNEIAVGKRVCHWQLELLLWVQGVMCPTTTPFCCLFFSLSHRETFVWLGLNILFTYWSCLHSVLLSRDCGRAVSRADGSRAKVDADIAPQSRQRCWEDTRGWWGEEGRSLGVWVFAYTYLNSQHLTYRGGCWSQTFTSGKLKGACLTIQFQWSEGWGSFLDLGTPHWHPGVEWNIGELLCYVLSLLPFGETIVLWETLRQRKLGCKVWIQAPDKCWGVSLLHSHWF